MYDSTPIFNCLLRGTVSQAVIGENGRLYSTSLAWGGLIKMVTCHKCQWMILLVEVNWPPISRALADLISSAGMRFQIVDFMHLI